MAEEPRREMPMAWVWLAMILTSLLPVLPALLMPAALGGDAHVHVLWQAHFAEAVRQGTFYPRWLPQMNDGFGSPAFFFYPPLLQWTAALFRPLLPSPGDAATRLALALWAISAAGGAGCWLWLRALGLGRAAALFGVLLFLLMPYRCFVDVYQRGALAEMAGICVMPWLLAFALRLKARRPSAWGSYALATGALLLGNLPAAQIGILFATAYAIVLAGRRDWAFLVRTASATMVGFAVAAINLATMLGDLGLLTHTADLWGMRNRPVNWLLFSAVPWVDPGVHRMTIGLTLFALLSGGLLAALILPVKPPLLRRSAIFLCAAIVAVAVLNTAIARPLWALDTPLSRIQFPFRLLAIDVLAITGLGAIALQRLDGAGGPRARLWRALGWLCVPALMSVNAGLFAFQVYRHPAAPAAAFAPSIDASEYVLGDLGPLERRFAGAKVRVVSGSACVVPVRWESRAVGIEVDAASASTLALRSFAFTGWDCRIDGGAWVRAQTPPDPLNVPVCSVPRGMHLLEARMPAQPAEQAGTLLTLAGLILALADMLAGRLRGRSRLAREPA